MLSVTEFLLVTLVILDIRNIISTSRHGFLILKFQSRLENIIFVFNSSFSIQVYLYSAFYYTIVAIVVFFSIFEAVFSLVKYHNDLPFKFIYRHQK